MDGLECSVVNKSEIERTFRIDSEFYGKEYQYLTDEIKKIAHKPLTKYASISDGNHAGISEKFSDEGVPYYRGQDAGTFFIENSTPICIDFDTFNMPVMRRSHLRKKDVLLSIIGTIGSLSLVYSDKEATCSCKLAILRPRKPEDAEMLAVFLNCKYGQMQIARFTRGAIQKGLILEDMDQLIMPDFGSKFKREIRRTVVEAHHRLELATTSIENAYSILTKNLDLDFSEQTGPAISIKPLSASFDTSGRLDAEYYQPKYDLFAETLATAEQGCSRVNQCFEPVLSKCDRSHPSYCYAEIGDVNVKTGTIKANIIQTEQLPDNAKIMTRRGDIVISTVRPNRGAVAIIEDDGVLVSGAFTVLREIGSYKKEVLQLLFRSPLYREWLLRYNVGTSYPVIKDEDVLNMIIPNLSSSEQLELTSKVQRAASLRRQSEELLEKAKRATEISIEESETVAIHWLGKELDTNAELS